MNKSQKIELLKVRDISSLLSDTFSFTKANFKSLFTGLFYICAPILLVYGICSVLFFNSYFNLILTNVTQEINENSYVSNDYSDMFLSIIPNVLFFSLSAFLAMSLVYTVSLCYIKLYKNNEEISTPILWIQTKKYFGKVIGSQFILLLATIIAYAVCFFPMIMGPIGAIFTVLFFIIFIFGLFYLYIKLIFAQAFIILEDKGIFESFKLSYKFTQGIFWNIFLFIFLMGLITSLFTYIFQLPGTILIYVNIFMGFANQNSSGNSFISLLGSALTGLGAAIGYVAYSIYYIGLSIFYYSTIENRTGIATNTQIENIGKTEDYDNPSDLNR